MGWNAHFFPSVLLWMDELRSHHLDTMLEMIHRYRGNRLRTSRGSEFGGLRWGFASAAIPSAPRDPVEARGLGDAGGQHLGLRLRPGGRLQRADRPGAPRRRRGGARSGFRRGLRVSAGSAGSAGSGRLRRWKGGCFFFLLFFFLLFLWTARGVGSFGSLAFWLKSRGCP